MTTLARCAANSSASPRPMPWPDLVTMASFPVQDAHEASNPKRRLPRASSTVTVADGPTIRPKSLRPGRMRTPPRIDTDTDVIYGDGPRGPSAGPPRARRIPRATWRSCGGRRHWTARHEGGTWLLGPRRRARDGHHGPTDRPSLHRPGDVLPPEAGRRRGGLRHEQHGSTPRSPRRYRLGGRTRCDRVLRQPEPLRPCAGRPCAKALTDIDERLDLVAILVGEPLPILRDAIAAQAKFAVVFAAGFAEVGAKGERLQDQMERDHRQRRRPRARPQYQPQCVRGVP